MACIFDDWYGWLMGASLQHLLHCDSWHERLIKASTGDGIQNRRQAMRYVSYLRIWLSALVMDHLCAPLWVTLPLDHASSPNTFCTSMTRDLPQYHDSFRLQGGLGALQIHLIKHDVAYTSLLLLVALSSFTNMMKLSIHLFTCQILIKCHFNFSRFS